MLHYPDVEVGEFPEIVSPWWGRFMGAKPADDPAPSRANDAEAGIDSAIIFAAESIASQAGRRAAWVTANQVLALEQRGMVSMRPSDCP
jgi:hypothetical protein